MANEDKATRYHRLGRRASLAATSAGAALLAVLAFGGYAMWLRDVVAGLAPGSFALSVALYTAIVVLLAEGVQLPFSYYQGITLERRYGLSTQTLVRWWVDRAKGTAVALVFAIAAALLVWILIRHAPGTWWIIAAAVFTALGVVLAQLAPVLLLPIFYDIRPLRRQDLVDRLIALAGRAHARVMGVFEWRLSDRTRKANAALAGIGRTRRILLSDTLLAEHSDDEIEVILAHELAHHVYYDIWTGIALEAALMTVGLYAADRVLAAVGPMTGLAGKADIAGMPLLVLTAAAVSFVLLPIAHLMSRHHERRADRYALEMTGNARAFVSAMKRLSLQNLAEDRPSRLVEVLFHSHPCTAARIEAAEAWDAGRGDSAGGPPLSGAGR